MAHPSSSLATLRPELGGSLEQFDLAMDRNGFIGTKVLPVFEAAEQSGTYGIIPLDQLLESPETRRAPGASYRRGQFDFTTGTFACEEHGWEEPVDDREARMYANYFDAEMVSAQRARDIVLRNMEIRIAAAIYDTGTWTPTAVTNEWDDVANATPITDVAARVAAMWEATGLWPNALIINRKQYHNLRRCDQIQDRMEQVDRSFQGDIGISQLQAAFDLPYILVGGSAKNTAIKGQTADPGPIWSDEYAAVARICSTNDIREPGLGRVFHWGADGSSIGATMESYRDETVRGDVIRARMDTDEKVLYDGCLQLLSNITT